MISARCVSQACCEVQVDGVHAAEVDTEERQARLELAPTVKVRQLMETVRLMVRVVPKPAERLHCQHHKLLWERTRISCKACLYPDGRAPAHEYCT